MNIFAPSLSSHRRSIRRGRSWRRLAGVALAAAAPVAALANPDLTALDLEQLLQLKVTGASKYEQKQSEVAAAVSVITRQDIRSFGWRTLDQALASLPGVYATYDRQYTYLGLRGFGLPGDYNTRVLLMIDGMRVNDVVYDGAPAGNEFPLDLDLVERIEFIPGPGSAVYGQNAMFGVVNVITRAGHDVDGIEFAVALQRPQALRHGRATWGRRLEGGTDLLVSVSTLRSRGEDLSYDFGAAGVSGVATGLDGERDREFFGRVGHGAWSFTYVQSDRRKDDPTAAFFGDPLVAGQFQADRYRLAQLQYEGRPAADSLQVLGRLFAGEEVYRSASSYGTPFGFLARGGWRGAELRLLSTAWQGHTLMLGAEYQDNPRADQNVLDLADPSGNRLIRRPGHRAGVYLQDEWQLSDAVRAIGGLRLDSNDVTGRAASPRAGLIWQSGAATTLKALYGRAHRAPNAYESAYGDDVSQVTNPTLGGERIETFELVADRRVGADLLLRAALYQWTMRDVIILGIEPVSGLSQYQAGAPVEARGLELSADRTWRSGARLRGSLALQHVATAGGAALLNSPRQLLRLNASRPLPLGGFHVGYELQAESSRLTLAGTRSGGFALSNLTLSTGRLARGLDVSVAVRNLFDRRYALPGADTNWQNVLEQDGRSLRVDLGVRF